VSQNSTFSNRLKLADPMTLEFLYLVVQLLKRRQKSPFMAGTSKSSRPFRAFRAAGHDNNHPRPANDAHYSLSVMRLFL
jgi:hypothetical protein